MSKSAMCKFYNAWKMGKDITIEEAYYYYYVQLLLHALEMPVRGWIEDDDDGRKRENIYHEYSFFFCRGSCPLSFNTTHTALFHSTQKLYRYYLKI